VRTVNFSFKYFLPLFAAVALVSLFSGRVKAQYQYEVIDLAHGIDDTYDSSSLIQSNLNVTATTSISTFNQLAFQPDVMAPLSDDGDVPPTFIDLITIDDNVKTDPVYEYAFIPGSLDAVGGYTPFQPNSPFIFTFPAELIVSEVPEPSAWGMTTMGIMALFIWAMRFSRRSRPACASKA
jgi:hypothetical protein